MLVYSHRDQCADAAVLLDGLHRRTDRLRGCASPPHDAIVDLFVRFGEFEAAVVDAVCGESDDTVPIAQICRRAAAAIADAVVSSIAASRYEVAAAVMHFRNALVCLDATALPREVRPKVAEGYAFRAVYPQMYMQAAREFLTALRPSTVCCIGIRSIGASLSAVVGSVLRRAGVAVTSFTVRPQGDPFARVLHLSPRLTQEILANARASHFAIVDEGPGMSGSTFLAVIERLRQLGIPEECITLFPSHDADPQKLVAPGARRAWTRCRRFTTSFEHAGMLEALAGSGSCVDLAAGQWRRHFLARASNPADWPAVHPEHERRKYLTDDRTLVRFAGLGPYGEAARVRAQQLADRGFAPPVDAMQHGFLRLTCLSGRPARAKDRSLVLLDRMAEYAAYLKLHAGLAADPSSLTSLVEMTKANIRQALGDRPAIQFDRALPRLLAFDEMDPVAVDGRMLPHEWLLTDAGPIKVDAYDHHRDDFFPGAPTDIAWDLAGASAEFELPPDEERYLIERYQAHSGDRDVLLRLPFFRIAYPAFRLGYATMAAQRLEGSDDGARFEMLRRRYAHRLRAHVDQAV